MCVSILFRISVDQRTCQELLQATCYEVFVSPPGHSRLNHCNGFNVRAAAKHLSVVCSEPLLNAIPNPLLMEISFRKLPRINTVPQWW